MEMTLRVAVANWSRRRAGGVESYLAFLLPHLVAGSHPVALLSEVDHPADREPITGAPLVEWCVSRDGVRAALDAIGEWEPDVVLVNGLSDLALEQQLLRIAPAVLVAHSYYGTCISGGKAYTFPAVVPCDRRFGAGCLAAFYPRRCGGLNPVTMAADYRRQRARLTLLDSYQRVLTLSSHMRREYLRHGCDPEHVVHLPPYVPAPSHQEPPAPREGPRQELRLLFAGRLDRLKGCEILIEALPHVAGMLRRPVVLDIAGDGPHRAHCMVRADAVVQDRGLTVNFHGWCAADRHNALLNASDVLVMPSLWPEPYGLAGIEAIVAGIPVAAFDVGAIREWLQPGVTGAIAPIAEGSAGLARAIAAAARIARRPPQSQASLRMGHQQHVVALLRHLMDAARSASSARSAGHHA